jgi:NAD(P)-dependent dehydrogenase (short-subunit alcohol dehydrogenase family)
MQTGRTELVREHPCLCVEVVACDLADLAATRAAIEEAIRRVGRGQLPGVRNAPPLGPTSKRSSLVAHTWAERNAEPSLVHRDGDEIKDLGRIVF